MVGFNGFGDPTFGGSPTPGGPSTSTDGGGSALGSILSNPQTLGYLQLLFGAAGGAAAGAADAKTSAARLAEQQREFDKLYGVSSGQSAVGAGRQLDSAPLRDQTMYKLKQFLSQTPAQFKPHDIFNGGGVAQPGGYDVPKLQAADAAYTPGAGGVNTDILKKFLASIGYGQPSTGGAFPASRIPIPMAPAGGTRPVPAIPQGVTL
jgi:hypothetical protein